MFAPRLPRQGAPGGTGSQTARDSGLLDAGRRAPVHASMSATVRWSRRMAGPDITLYLVHLDIDVARHPDPAPAFQLALVFLSPVLAPAPVLQLLASL